MDNELEKYKKAVLEKASENNEFKDEKLQLPSAETKDNDEKNESEKEHEIEDEKDSSEKKVGTETSSEEKKDDEKNESSLPSEEDVPPMSTQIPLEQFDMENRVPVRLHGVICEGAMRGKQLIERHGKRLEHMLGYYPFPGTLNVKLDRRINMEDFETTRLQHHLLDGRVWVDARLAKAKLHKNGISEDCWVIREETSVHEEEIIEIISKDMLQEKLHIKEDDEVEVELYLKTKQNSYEKFKRVLHRFVPKSKRIMKA